MDRNTTLWSGGSGLGAVFANLPARSNTVPPKNVSSLNPFEKADLEVTANLDCSSDPELLQTPGWIESQDFHVAPGVVPTGETDLFTARDKDRGHVLDVGHMQGDVQQAFSGEAFHSEICHAGNTHMPVANLSSQNEELDCNADDDQLQSLQGFGFGSAATLAPPFGNSLVHQPSFGAMATHAVPTLIRMAREARLALASPGETFYSLSELYTLEHHFLEPCPAQSASSLDTQQAKHGAIAARVRDLNLCTSPALESCRSCFGRDSVSLEDSKTTTPGEEWLQPYLSNLDKAMNTMQPGYDNATLQLGHPDYQTATSCLTQNPMWGLSSNYAGPSFDNTSRNSIMLGNNGSDGLLTSENSSSLSFSRSLPELSTMLRETWSSQADLESLEADGRNEPVSRPEEAEELEARTCVNRHGAAAELNRGHYNSVDLPFRRGGSPLQGEAFTRPGTSSVNVSANLLGGRMEEGCIGSRKRIWYRAPNGQFVSATQALSGQFVSDGDGNSYGQGSSTGSEGIRRIRRRRKSEEVERKYRCDYDGCEKAYGTLNRKSTQS